MGMENEVSGEQTISGAGSGAESGTSSTPTIGGFDFDAAAETLSQDLFGGSETAEEVVEGEEVTPEVKEPETPSAEPVVAKVPDVQAPKTWRPEAAAKFATLPPEVQAEVLKREEDIFKGLEGYKADATAGKTFQSLLRPYEHLFKAANLDPVQQVGSLLQAHVALATGTPEQKRAFFQQLATSYNVNLDEEAPYIDPEVAALRAELSSVKSQIMGREQKEVEKVRSTLQTEIDTFASDPAHQYFDEVANDIAGLLRSGTAKDLADAYEKAVWANPVTRAKEQARLTAEVEAKAKAEAASEVAKARKATGANVKSTAKVASGTAPLGSIDDTLAAALHDIRART